MKIIRGIGEGIQLVLVLLAMGILCLIFGSWNPGSDDQ